MGLRTQKSKTIAPGVRVSTTGKSASVSFGGKSGRVSVNSSGKITKSAHVPGTGISYVSSSGGGQRRASTDDVGSFEDSPMPDETLKLIQAAQESKQQRLEHATPAEMAQLNAMEKYKTQHDPKAFKVLGLVFFFAAVIFLFITPACSVVFLFGIAYSVFAWFHYNKKCKSINSYIAVFYNGGDLPEKW